MFDLIQSHSSSMDSIFSDKSTFTKKIDYVLVREKNGEARGVFRVPESPFYSVKMRKRKRFPILGLTWRTFVGFLGSRKEMEPITESQFESYIVFGLREFKTKQNIPPKNLMIIAASSAIISGIAVGNALSVAFDWYSSVPEMMLVVSLGLGISLSIMVINIYRGKWKR